MQLIEIFVSGLNSDELKKTILRRNPQTFDEATGIATSEAILRQKISAGNRVSADRNLGPVPMEVDPMRGLNVTNMVNGVTGQVRVKLKV